MVKKIKTKPGKGKMVNLEKKLEQNAQELLEKGEMFGDGIIIQMSFIATNPIGVGAVTLGLAKAYAALKDVAGRLGVEIESLFEKERAYFEDKFDELLDQEEMK